MIFKLFFDPATTPCPAVNRSLMFSALKIALAALTFTNCALKNIHDGDTLTAWCPPQLSAALQQVDHRFWKRLQGALSRSLYSGPRKMDQRIS